MTTPMTAPTGQHARHRLDEVIHSPVRLSIVAALAGVDEAEFSAVRDAVQISDSVLSKQASILEASGYLRARKGYVGKRPRTWLSLTEVGRARFHSHLGALREIVQGDHPDQPAPGRSRPSTGNPNVTVRT